MVKTWEEKIDASVEDLARLRDTMKPATTSQEETEKLSEIFKTKGVEKPKGEYADKQKR